MLLIGGDSYIGRSISSHFNSNGNNVTSFSNKKKYSNYSYNEFDVKFFESNDFAVVVGTPGHYRTQNGLKNIAKILRSLSESSLNVYVISTIHTLTQEIGNNNEYIRLNKEFEQIAHVNNFQVIRIPNFIGLIPSMNENQSRLLPWSLLDNFLTHGYLQINSSLESEFEWITAADLCDGILILENNSAPEKVELQPGFRITLGDLVQTFSEFATTNQNLSVRVQVTDRENQRKIISGENPMGALGWKSKLTDKMLQSYLQDYLRQNWKSYA